MTNYITQNSLLLTNLLEFYNRDNNLEKILPIINGEETKDRQGRALHFCRQGQGSTGERILRQAQPRQLRAARKSHR